MNKRHSAIWLWCSLDILIGMFATIMGLSVLSNSRTAGVGELGTIPNTLHHFFLLVLFLITWTGVHHLFGLHAPISTLNLKSLASRVLLSDALGCFFILTLAVQNHALGYSVTPTIVFFLSALACSMFFRVIIWQSMTKLNGSNSTPARILIIGSGPIAEQVFTSLQESRPNAHVLGFVDSPGSHRVPDSIAAKMLGGLEELETFLMSTAVDEVMVSLPMRSCYDRIQEVIDICERVGVPVAYAYQPFRHMLGYSRVEQSPSTHIRWRPSRDVESDPVKRTLDLLCSGSALLLLMPVFAAIAISIKLSSPGPVFFVQERYGLNKRKFRMYKFRTMVPDAEARLDALEAKNEAQGPVFKMKKDPRVTRIGTLLRKSSLDELPQLVNVLKGDMSLVGPRPLPNRDVANFNDSWLMRRFSVKPGLTCLWQVNGRSNTSFDEWITLDLKYIDNWSPLLDLKILLLTIPAVMRGSGAM